MRSGWPMIGREAELSAITEDAQARGGIRPVVLAGAPGVGKTRLAREALHCAQSKGRRIHWIVATESSRRLPLGAFALAVGNVGGDPITVLQRAAENLVAGAGAEGPVIAVDDAHLLDAASASLVQQLVTHQRATLILTVRSGAPTPDAIASLWKDGYLDRHDVQVLTRLQVSTLLAAVLCGPVAASTSRQLYDLCSGNVLLLRQLVVGELAAGHFQQLAGTWQWHGKLAISAELTDLIHGRLTAVNPQVSDLIDILALVGPTDTLTLAKLTSPKIIEEAESLGLVRVGGTGESPLVRLDHPLYGEVRMAHLGKGRARRLRGAMVEALAEGSEASPGMALRRALLSLESDVPVDPELLTAGAQAALQRSDFTLARRLALAAIDAGGGFESQLTLSWALGLGLDPQAADEVLAAMTANAKDEFMRLRAIIPRAGHLYFEQGRAAEAKQLLDQARSEVVDTSLLPLVNAIYGVFLAMSGEPYQALALAESVVAVEPLPPLIAVCARWARVSARCTIGQTDVLGEPEIRVHEAVIGSYETCLPRLGYGEQHLRTLGYAGRIEEAITLTKKLCPDVAGTGLLASMSNSLKAFTHLARGQVQTARELAERCVADLLGNDKSGWLYTTLMLHSLSCGLTGDAAGARAAAVMMDQEQHPGFDLMEPDRILTWAWVEASEGAISLAIQHARAAAAIAAERGHWGPEAYALAAATRIGDTTTAARLQELGAIVEGPRVAAAAQQAAGLATDDAAVLISASRRFEAMGDLLSAADAAAQATQIYTRQGLRSAQHAAGSRAARLRSDCQGACTPALLLSGCQSLPLTVREREIVTLAANGFTNRQISNRLVISIRTVEGHLYRASAKLGTDSRREFKRLLQS